MKKTIILALLCLGITFPGFAQNLEECFKIAAKNNPGLQAKYKSFEAALQQLPQVSSLADPNFSFGYFILPVETRVGPQRFRFSLTQMFPWFGTLKAQRDAAALLADAKFQDFLDARNKLYFDLALAWYSLYDVHQTIAIEEENISILESYKVLSTSRFENGTAPMTDVLRVELMMNEASTQLAIQKLSLQPFQTRLNNLMNRKGNESIDGPDSLDIYELPRQYQENSTFAGNPKLESLELKAQATEAREQAIIRQGRPKIGAGLDYVIVGERTDMAVSGNGRDILMPMATISLPIFRGKYDAARKEQQLMREALVLEKEELVNQLSTSRETLWFELQNQASLAQLYDQQIADSKRILNLQVKAYGNTGSDFEEVLRTHQQILKFQRKRAAAFTAYHKAICELEYITAKDR